MHSFRFCVRTVPGRFTGVPLNLIHYSKNGGPFWETWWVAHPESLPEENAAELKRIQHMQDHTRDEWNAPFFAAIKAFICMGHNSSLIYEVDGDLNVYMKPAEWGANDAKT